MDTRWTSGATKLDAESWQRVARERSRGKPRHGVRRRTRYRGRSSRCHRAGPAAGGTRSSPATACTPTARPTPAAPRPTSRTSCTASSTTAPARRNSTAAAPRHRRPLARRPPELAARPDRRRQERKPIPIGGVTEEGESGDDSVKMAWQMEDRGNLLHGVLGGSLLSQVPAEQALPTCARQAQRTLCP